jgi:DNA-binding transcriptional MerR regulator
MSVDLGDLGAEELRRCSGITYRQLDYWTTQGWLRANERPDRKQGTGYRRTYPDAELDIADGMRRLIGAGLTAPAAARVARTGEVRVRLIIAMLTEDD